MQEDMGRGLNTAKLAGSDQPPARVHIEIQSLDKEVEYLAETLGAFGNRLMPILNFENTPTDTQVDKEQAEISGNLISTKLKRIKTKVSRLQRVVHDMQKRLEI